MKIDWSDSEKNLFHWWISEKYFFTDESVKKQMTDSISENLTDSDLESTEKKSTLILLVFIIYYYLSKLTNWHWRRNFRWHKGQNRRTWVKLYDCIWIIIAFIELSKLCCNKIKVTSPTVFDKLTWLCIHDYTCILLIATIYIHLLQIIKHTFLNSNVSDLGIRILNITSNKFSILFYLKTEKNSRKVFLFWMEWLDSKNSRR